MKRRGALPLLLAATLLLPAAACAQSTPASADAALREGRYDDAISAWESILDREPSNESARRSLAGALLDVGEYDRAAEVAEGMPYLRGEALHAVGRYEEAQAAYRAAAEAGGRDRWSAELRLGELDLERGRVDEALDRFDSFITLYNGTPGLSAQDLTAVGNAVWYLGGRDAQLFQDAVMAFDEATRTDPTYLPAHLRLGELFVEKYNGEEAATALSDASGLNPRNPDVLLAQARADAFEGDRGEGVKKVRTALEVNPNFVSGHAFLARMYLDVEDHENALAELEQALEVNPNSLEALAMLAATYYVGDDDAEYRQTRQRFERLNPRSAQLLSTVAEIAAQQRRYADARDLALEATRLDPNSWTSLGVLGLNQFRLGRIDEARSSLELAFGGDPYNVWIKNNLDLLDTFEGYRTIREPGFEFMLQGDEADALLPYVEIAATEAYADLSARYNNRDRERVRVELYPRSADFSVRTVGLAGLGALGVSFGDVVALDSPSARGAGEYNWLTTLWHEMAHTLALAVSRNRVPRWFTEGLSVWEERRARPSWGYPITPELLVFYDDGELPPVSRLNEGFMRPASPRHLSGAYDLASLVIDWIVEREGFDAIVEALQAYGEGLTNDEVLQRVLGMEPEQIDAAFDRWMRENHDPETGREFGRLMQEGSSAAEEGNDRRALELLGEAAQLFPYSRTGSPWTMIAKIHMDNGDTDQAIEALEALSLHDETAFDANRELARLLEARGDKQGAADALERAVWIYPLEMEPHADLARLSADLDDWDRAVRERRVLLGLDPANRAQALYQLALAKFNAGDRAGARSDVLQALESAPSFEEAQELLLRLHEPT